MADEPLTTSEVYRGYRRGPQNISDMGCCLLPFVWFALLIMAIANLAIPELDSQVGHIAAASLSTILIWVVFIKPGEEVGVTTFLAIVAGGLLSLVWLYLPYLMTGLSLAIGALGWWIARSEAKRGPE